MISSASDLEEVRKRRLLIDRCDAYLFESIRPFLGRRVLEIGCGHGNLTTHLLDRDLVLSTDIEPSSIEQVRLQFGKYPNVVAQVCDITAPSALDLKQFDCDTVVCLNTLEHIQDDERALSNIAQIVSPHGRAVIIVPAFQFLYGTMDSSIGHYRRYTKRDLGIKLTQAGMQIESQAYFNLLGMLGWFVNGRILRRNVPPASQLSLFNLIFPVTSRIEAFLPHFAGLSLISVSHRP